MRAVLAILPALAAMAQTPAAESTGSVAGVVKETASHTPLAGVRVFAGQASASTGSLGEFLLEDLEPGQLWISADDRSRAGSGGTQVLLHPGQHLTGVDIYLKSGGSIAGRVRDDDGLPVAGASVVLLRAEFEFGELAYSPELSTHTDARGDYRLAPVPADRPFLILARQPVKPDAAQKAWSAKIEKRPTITAPAFFPASPDAQSAQPVTIGSSEDRRAADIRMARVTPYCIAGSLDMPSDAPAEEINIEEQLALTFNSTFAPLTAPISDGHFRACGLHPGDYKLTASHTEGPRSERWWIRSRLSITDRDAEDVRLSPAGLTTIAGDTSWDPAPRDQPEARVSVNLEKYRRETHADSIESQGGLFSGMIHGDHVHVPGPFTLGSMPVDDYIVTFREIPEGCYVKEASLGDSVLLNHPLRLAESASGRMRVVIGCDAGSLTARVTDADGNPVSHVNLYVMPEDAGSAAALSAILQEASVEDGWSETVESLRPGKYLLLACDIEMDGSSVPVLELWNRRSQATLIEISPRENVRVTLEVAARH